MEYDPIYHVTCRLQHESGRELILNQLEQSQTYAGMLEGVPDKKANDWGIDLICGVLPVVSIHWESRI
jgi:hypothetical protein